MMGKPLDRFQTLLVRFVIECGLAATLYALVGVLLAPVGSPLRCYGAWRARHSACTASSTRSTMCTGGAG
jgi:hypothetical protein